MNAFGQTTTILSLSSACWIPWAREEVDEVLQVEDGLEEGLQGLLQLLQLAHNQCTLSRLTFTFHSTAPPLMC